MATVQCRWPYLDIAEIYVEIYGSINVDLIMVAPMKSIGLSFFVYFLSKMLASTNIYKKKKNKF